LLLVCGKDPRFSEESFTHDDVNDGARLRSFHLIRKYGDTHKSPQSGTPAYEVINPKRLIILALADNGECLLNRAGWIKKMVELR